MKIERHSAALCLYLAVMPVAGNSLHAAPNPLSNLALNKPCQVFSSWETNGWSASNLTDGKTGSPGWRSRAFSAFADHQLYPEYVVLDLETNCALRRIVLYPCTSGSQLSQGFPEDYTIQVCQEGEPWRTILERRACPVPVASAPPSFDVDATARFVKIEATRLRAAGTSSQYAFQLAEVEVYGQTQPAAPLVSSSPRKLSETTVSRLRCENRDNPVGMDAPSPRFSWWLTSSVRGRRQTAYRVLVAQSLDALNHDQGDAWDSGKVEADTSIAVPYRGQPLSSGRKYWWKVVLWLEDGQPTNWSAPATFITGKLLSSDWKGRWVGADRDPQHRPVYLRKEILVSKPVKCATVFFCGLGFSELFINGTKVGDYVIGPGFTTYNKRAQYLTFDVTEQFATTGPAALGVILADGWYALERDPWVHHFEQNPYVDKPKLLLDLELEYEDGSKARFVSDDSWKWMSGEITRSWIAQEDIDRREARPGWNRVGYQATDLRPVAIVPGPAGQLVSQKEPPCRIVGEVHPVSLRYDSAARTWIYELGRETTGWVRFRTAGPRGTHITLTALASRPIPRTSHFILAGEGRPETYEPRFFYNGMRRVEVSGLAQPPALDDLVVRQVSSSWPVSGGFRCSDDLANWLNDMVRRTVVAFTTFLPNDPVREWKAWMEDPQNMFRSLVYLFDAQTLYERWEWDILDGQRPDGNCPNVAPGAFFDDYNSPWWGGCVAWVPWHWYQYYGDPALLKQSFPAMKRYVGYLDTVATNGVQDWGLLDWLPVEETPRPIINTPAHYLFANIVSHTAEMLGRTADAAAYAEKAGTIRSNFNRLFLDRASGIYGVPGWVCRQGNSTDTNLPHQVWWTGDRACTEAGQALPLALGLVPSDCRPAVEQALLNELKAHHNRVSSGFVSTPYLLEVLADLAPRLGWLMTSARDYPSWYSMTVGSDHDLAKETWAGGMALMPSLGGNIVGWQMESLAGIRPDPAVPGFKTLIIKPNLVGSLHWVDAWYDSVYGQIRSHWCKRGSQLLLDVTIPPNTTATVFVPAREPKAVTEGGRPAEAAPGVKYLRFEDGRAVFKVSSGGYSFMSTLPTGR